MLHPLFDSKKSWQYILEGNRKKNLPTNLFQRRNAMMKYVAAAVAGCCVGLIAGKGLPDQFSINIPYGPKFSYKRKTK